MTDSIVVVATFRPVPGSAPALSTLVEEYVPVSQQDAGNIRYALHDAGEGVLVVIEEWTDQQAFEAHGASPAFTEFSTAVAPLVDGQIEVRVLRPRSVGDAAKGAL